MKPKEIRILNALAPICSLLAAVFGFAALLGWILDLPVLSSFGTRLIPMAPSTAMLFGLLGSALFFYTLRPESRAVRRLGIAVGASGAAVSLVLLILSSQGIYLNAEHLGIPISGSLDGAPFGHMSAVTAFLFLLVSLSFLLPFSPVAGRPLLALAANGIAFLVALAGYVFMVGYFVGLPLLYSGNTIPPALPTSLAFLALGIAIWARGRLQNRPPAQGVETISPRIPYFIFLLFAILALSIATIGYLYYRNYEHKYRTEVERQLSAIGALKVGELEDWRAERLGNAEVMRQNPAFAALVERYLENPADDQAVGQLQTWLDALRRAYLYDGVFLLDVNGVERIGSPVSVTLADEHLAGEISPTLALGQVVFMDFHRHVDGTIHLALLVPIYSGQDPSRPLGVLVFMIDPDTYLYPFLNEWPIPSDTAETLLVRRDGEDVLFLSPLRFRPDAALDFRVPLTNTEVLAVKAILGETGIVEGIDYRGERVVGDLSPAPGTSWFLVARMDAAEIYAPLRERLGQTIVFFGALIAVSGAGLVLAWRQQRIRFYRERYEAAEALRSAHERLQSFVDANIIGVVIASPSGGVFEVNDYYLQTIGYTRQEFEQGSVDWRAITPPEWLPADEQAIAELRERGKCIPYEKEYLRPDGTRVSVFLSDAILPGPEQQIAAFVLDVTERKRAEKALRESEERFRTLVEQATIAIFVQTRGQFAYANRAALRLFGADADSQLLGQPVLERFHPSYRSGVMERIHQLNDQRQEVPLLEEVILRLDGGAVPVEVSAAPMLYREEHGAVVFILDITERKQAEKAMQDYSARLETDVQERTRELRDAQEKLVRQERLAVLGQLAGSIAHELRNPLGVISNAAIFLKMVQPEADANIKEYLDIIESETRTGEKIITDLLDYTRSRPVDRMPISVSGLVDSTLKRFPPPSAVQASIELPADLPPAYVDPRQMEQVLGNLTVNACQSMPDGGKLTLSASLEGDMIKLAVQDTGIGISTENMSKLFEPLFTTKTKGIGLGLAVSRKMTEANGGRIEVLSELGKGSTFSIYLPVNQEGK